MSLQRGLEDQFSQLELHSKSYVGGSGPDAEVYKSVNYSSTHGGPRDVHLKSEVHYGHSSYADQARGRQAEIPPNYINVEQRYTAHPQSPGRVTYQLSPTHSTSSIGSPTRFGGQGQNQGQGDKGSLSPYAEEDFIPPAAPSKASFVPVGQQVPPGGRSLYQHGSPHHSRYSNSPGPSPYGSQVSLSSSKMYDPGYTGERSRLLFTAPTPAVYGEPARSVPVDSLGSAPGPGAEIQAERSIAEPPYPYSPSHSMQSLRQTSPGSESKPPFSPQPRSPGSYVGPRSPGARSPGPRSPGPRSPLSSPTHTLQYASNRSLNSPMVPRPSSQPVLNPAKMGQEAEVDALTSLLLQNMEASADPEFFGMCSKCEKAIMGEDTGCTALEQMYHIDCFTCFSCDVCLKGQPFFALEGHPYCEPCYLNTLEKCNVCARPITDRILRATGKPYHPGCFTCVVCGKSLDGIEFTVDASNNVHCIEDFHKKFAPRCCVCHQPIVPEPGNEETVRVVAMDKSFHVMCYKCEDCGLVLSSEADGRGCYPLDDHILCKACNARWIQALTTKMNTEL